MKYIVHRRFKKEVICGNVNIPAMTEVESVDGCIIYNGKIVCFDTSEDAHQFFARNDDGSGMLRGRLTQSIQKLLSERDPNYQQRWDKIWADELCQAYKRPEYEDFWLWNHAFFNADIDALKHIAKLIGLQEGD